MIQSLAGLPCGLFHGSLCRALPLRCTRHNSHYIPFGNATHSCLDQYGAGAGWMLYLACFKTKECQLLKDFLLPFRNMGKIKPPARLEESLAGPEKIRQCQAQLMACHGLLRVRIQPPATGRPVRWIACDDIEEEVSGKLRKAVESGGREISEIRFQNGNPILKAIPLYVPAGEPGQLQLQFNADGKSKRGSLPKKQRDDPHSRAEIENRFRRCD